MAIYKNSPPIVTNGLVIYYDLSNVLSNVASAVLNNLGDPKYNNSAWGTPRYRNTPIGPVLYNDENSNFISVPNTSGSGVDTLCFDNTGLTVNMWLSIDDYAGTSGQKARAILHKDKNFFSDGWSIDTASGSLYSISYTHQTDGGINYKKNILLPATSSWFNLTVTRNPIPSLVSISSSYLYINGQEAPTTYYQPFTTNLTSDSASAIVLGDDTGGQNGVYSGSMSIIQLYNRPLSAAEVKQNYDALKSRFNLL